MQERAIDIDAYIKEIEESPTELSVRTYRLLFGTHTKYAQPPLAWKYFGHGNPHKPINPYTGTPCRQSNKRAQDNSEYDNDSFDEHNPFASRITVREPPLLRKVPTLQELSTKTLRGIISRIPTAILIAEINREKRNISSEGHITENNELNRIERSQNNQSLLTSEQILSAFGRETSTERDSGYALRIYTHSDISILNEVNRRAREQRRKSVDFFNKLIVQCILPILVYKDREERSYFKECPLHDC